MYCERLFTIKIKHMKYSREYIISSAFDVFMEKGYDSASISVLQKELSMSRGAMYRYFKNKEELFTSVIDEYFFKTYDRLTQNIDPTQTLAQFIKNMYRRQKLVVVAFTKAGFTQTVFLNYTALMIQAAKHYPNFVTRFREINSRLMQAWRTAIHNSIKINEIRSDIDVEIMCYLFSNISVKETSDQEYDESMFSHNAISDMHKRKEIIDYLYSLIKI